jgi:hypothetical protein
MLQPQLATLNPTHASHPTRQSLNDAKDLLARLTAEGSALRASLAAKQRELGGFDDDLVRTCGQSEAAAASFRKLRAQQKDA